MRYATIKHPDISNGPGVRVSVFVSGCDLGCDDCFNRAAWDFDYGSEWTDRVRDDVVAKGDSPWCDALSVLGGEPLHPDHVADVADLVETWCDAHPDKPAWVWSGYTWGALERMGRAPSYGADLERVLSRVAVLVDGPFVKGRANASLRWRGSANQRVIDVPTTRAGGKVVVLDVDGSGWSVQGEA